MIQRFRLSSKHTFYGIGGLVVVAMLAGFGVAEQSENDRSGVIRIAQKSRTKRGKQSTKKAPPKSKIPRGKQKQRPPVTKVNASWGSQVAASAAKIDKLISAGYAKHRVTPELKTTDSQFLRRIYLDITGTIPTLQQTEKFLRSTELKKREHLIDKLLNSHGYISHHFNYLGNILRLVDRPNNNNWGQPYQEWIKENLRQNTPWDQMVQSMLTAEGKIWENGATGYLFRDSGMELDAMNNTVRVFLGTRIGCAQCHDHPFDRWTQHEFYQMAAFMYGTRTRQYAGNKKLYGNKNPVRRLKDDLKKIEPNNRGGGDFNRMIQANFFTVYEQPRGLRLPHDYQYDDAKPKQVVPPKPILGQPIKLAKGDSPRKAFADWMTSPKNPRFAMSMANRLWKKSMGIGLIEPADDIQDASEPSNKELLKFLTDEFVRLKFDMKEFQRIIYNTKTYQRQAHEKSVDFSEPYYYPGPLLRRMTAEQAWDSLLTLAVYNVDSFERVRFTNGFDKLVEVDLKNATAQQVLNKSKQYAATYGPGAERKANRAHSYKGLTLARASELPLPVPANHFLRQFGQGDRELIDGATSDGSVSQILTMFNGHITHMMLERGSVIYDNVINGRTTKDRISRIFYSILNRRPTSGEFSTASDEIKDAKEAGYGNVIWALVNTKEFLFIQ